MSLHNVLPFNNNHNVSAHQKHSPLLYLKEQEFYQRLHLKQKHRLMQMKLKSFRDIVKKNN